MLHHPFSEEEWQGVRESVVPPADWYIEPEDTVGLSIAFSKDNDQLRGLVAFYDQFHD